MKRKHVVVDGSNIATEGRATPSLAQLDSAVRALLAEYPYEHTTVVVDATFGHRIDAKERKAFEEAVLEGELITPPAGAIGRGDAFVLQIADRAGADVFSNDSFQEFHGQYPWLFEEGRLIGGKPVPNVGWVFVLRSPVRGPTSRRSVRDARKDPRKEARKESRKETRKGPVKKTAPPKVPKAVSKPAAKAALEPAPVEKNTAPRARRRRPSVKSEPINDQLVYAAFVVDHPVGTIVEGVVDRFASHGAYIHVGDAQCYVPLRELGDPPPRSAREVLNLGETRPFTVQRFDPARRGIDVVPVLVELLKTESGTSAAEAVAVAAGSTNQETDAEEAPVSPAAKKAAKRKAPAKRKAAAKRAPAKRKTAAKKAPAKRKSAAKKAPAKRKAAKKAAPAKKRPAKRKAAAKKAPAKRKSAAKKAPAKRKAAKKKAPAKKRPAKRKAAAKKAPAKRKATRKRAAAKKR